jgi:hypothetical protein
MKRGGRVFWLFMDDNLLDMGPDSFQKKFHLFQIRKNSLHFHRRHIQFRLLEVSHR